MSESHWRHTESGYESKGGMIIPVRPSAPTLARMAAAVGVSPDQLDGAGQPAAADVLREIIRTAPEPEPEPRPMTDVMVWVAARMRAQGRPLDDAEALFRHLGWHRDSRMKAPADITAREARVIAAELGVNAREVYEQLGLLDAGDLDARGPQPPSARSRPEDEQWGQVRKA